MYVDYFLPKEIHYKKYTFGYLYKASTVIFLFNSKGDKIWFCYKVVKISEYLLLE